MAQMVSTGFTAEATGRGHHTASALTRPRRHSQRRPTNGQCTAETAPQAPTMHGAPIWHSAAAEALSECRVDGRGDLTGDGFHDGGGGYGGRWSLATVKRIEGGKAQLKMPENGRNSMGRSFSQEMVLRPWPKMQSVAKPHWWLWVRMHPQKF
jgi:hypothetical protein